MKASAGGTPIIVIGYNIRISGSRAGNLNVSGGLNVSGPISGEFILYDVYYPTSSYKLIVASGTLELIPR